MEKIRTVKEIHNIDFSYKKMLSSEYAKEYVNGVVQRIEKQGK